MYTSEVVSLRLPPSIVAELDRLAGVELRSRSNMAARLIVQGLADSVDDTNEEGTP